MKRLIGITGAILMTYVILTAVAAPSGNTALSASADIVTEEMSAEFTAREEDDRIVIYAGDDLVMKTDVRVSQLPKIDRMRLREGIDLFSEKELRRFMEDYCS